MTPCDQAADCGNSRQVRDQVPARVHVPADICFSQSQAELNDFIEATKAHRGGSSQRLVRLPEHPTAEIAMFQILKVQVPPAFTDRRIFFALRALTQR